MSPEWQKVSLGELIRLDRRPVDVVSEQLYQEIGIYSHGRGIFHKTPRTGLEIGEKNLFLLRKGDLILQITFAWEGAIALCSEAEAGLYGSVRFPTYRIDERKCYAPYLVRYLSSRKGLEQVGRICPGSAGRNRVLALKRLPEIVVPLPPMSEQRQIVHELDALGAKISEARTLREEASAQSSRLWAACARRVLDTHNHRAPKLRLGDLVNVRGGGTPSKGDPRFWGGSIPWITPKDMKKRELTDAIDHITEEATRETAAKLIGAGPVLIVVRGMILAHTVPIALLRAPAAINQDMKALTCREGLLPEFLSSSLWAMNSDVLELVDRSGHDTRKLNTDKLLDFRIHLPSVKTQEAVVRQLNSLQVTLQRVKDIQTETDAELKSLFPGVQDRAFNRGL